MLLKIILHKANQKKINCVHYTFKKAVIIVLNLKKKQENKFKNLYELKVPATYSMCASSGISSQHTGK